MPMPSFKKMLCMLSSLKSLLLLLLRVYMIHVWAHLPRYTYGSRRPTCGSVLSFQLHNGCRDQTQVPGLPGKCLPTELSHQPTLAFSATGSWFIISYSLYLSFLSTWITGMHHQLHSIYIFFFLSRSYGIALSSLMFNNQPAWPQNLTIETDSKAGWFLQFFF